MTANRSTDFRSGTGRGKLIVFVGAVQSDIERLAEMAGQTLGLQRMAPVATSGRDNRVSPYTFLQMMQDGEFVDIYEQQGELYGIRTEDLDKRLDAGHSLFLTAGQSLADKLKARYDSRVCRVFIHPERRPTADALETAWVAGGSAVLEAQAADDHMLLYPERCEFAFRLQDDEAYTMFAMAQALEPVLERGLIEYD